MSEALGKLRVAEAFIGTAVRWQHQPGVKLSDELDRAARGVHDAIVALGAEASPLPVAHPPEYFATRTDILLRETIG